MFISFTRAVLRRRSRRAALAVVSAIGVIAATAGSAWAAGSVAIAVNTAVPEQAIPVQLGFSGSAPTTDSSGDGASVYAVIRPAGGVACQPTFESDQAAASGASTTLLGDFGAYSAPGPYSFTATYTPPDSGGYLLCAWLEHSDAQGNPVTDASSSADFLARGPQVEQLSVSLPQAAKPNQAFAIDVTTQTDQQLNAFSIIKHAGSTPCAASYELDQGANQPEDSVLGTFGQSVFGGPVVSSGTVTETRGPYLICTWVEGPNQSEVDASSSTPIYVGTPPAPPAPPPRSLGLKLGRIVASRRHGVTVRGSDVAGFIGRLTIGAACGRSHTTTHRAPFAGRFSAHLRLPRGCRHRTRTKITVTWPGSASFLRQSASRTVHIGR